MSQPSLIAKLGIDEKDFARGLAASVEGLAQTQEKAKLLAAEVALLEQRMASNKTDAMVSTYKALTTSLRETRAEAEAMGRQLKALEAIKPPAAASDDSGAYAAHWDKVEAQRQAEAESAERARRARVAAESAPKPMPKAFVASAEVQVEAAMAEAAGGFALSRMGKMELGHVARSLAGSVSAGVPIGNALEMEAPRILQALGPALGALLPILAALAPALAAVTLAAAAHKAENEARPLRRETGRIAAREAGNSEQYEELALDTEEQVLKVREKRKKRSRLAKIQGKGVNRRDEADAEVAAVNAAGNLDEALERQSDREQREFEGDPQAARDKLAEDRDAKIAAAKRKHHGGSEAARRRREALTAKAQRDYELDVQKLEREEANRHADLDAQRDTNTAREEGANMAVEGPALRARNADAKLKNGPQFGPEHDANKEGARTAHLDADDAANQEKTRAAGVAAEERILQIKREGFDVDKRIAQERLKVAEAALANSREKSGADYDALQHVVNAGRAEIEAAGKVTGEQRAQAFLEERAANLRGSSFQVRKATLDLERGDIGRRMLESAGQTDKLPGLTAELARNQQQREELERSERENQARARLDVRAANLRGSSTQVRQGSLDLEREDISRRMLENAGQSDKLPGFAAELARNKQQQDELAKAEKLRAIDTRGTEDHANTGRGAAAQLGFLEREIERVGERKEWNKNENGNDAGTNAQLDDTLHNLTQAIQDLAFAEQARLTQLNNEKMQIGRRGYQPTQGDKDHDTDDRFNRERADAIHHGASKQELDAIEGNRAADHLANAADERQMTPEQKLERMRHNNARDRAVGSVQSYTGRTKAKEAKGNASTFDAYVDSNRPIVGKTPLHVPNRIDEVKAGAANAGKGDGNAWKGENIVEAVHGVKDALGGAFKNR